ncbi:hypothetical protein AAHB53_27350 [Niallia circulans]
MKEIIFVTTNKGKIASAEKELKNIKVTPIQEELSEPRTDDIKEIAKQKSCKHMKSLRDHALL